MSIHFKQITIIGVGLIGGSFARACKKKKIAEKIIGCGRGEENLRKGVELGVIDDYSLDLVKAVDGSDLILLAPPVEAIITVAKALAPCIRPGIIVTDAGSVKGEITRRVEELLPDARFVGAHPIAGTEKGGVEASFDTLFEGAKCIVTPHRGTNPEALEKVKALWGMLGSDVIEMDPGEHDLILSGVSHLPHVVAYALVNAVTALQNDTRDLLRFSAGGFRDITRIASSSPSLWREICLMNREKLLETMKGFKTVFEKIEHCIQEGKEEELEEIFGRAQRVRESME